MVEATPSPPFEMPEPDLLLQLLIIALDAPLQQNITFGNLVDLTKLRLRPGAVTVAIGSTLLRSHGIIRPTQ